MQLWKFVEPRLKKEPGSHDQAKISLQVATAVNARKPMTEMSQHLNIIAKEESIDAVQIFAAQDQPYSMTDLKGYMAALDKALQVVIPPSAIEVVVNSREMFRKTLSQYVYGF